MSSDNELRSTATPGASSETAPFASFPFCYTFLPQQDALRSLQFPLPQVQRHLCPSPRGVPPILNLSANPLFFGTVLAAAMPPPVTALQYYYSFPASGQSYAEVSADGLRLASRGGDPENEGSSEKFEKMSESDAASSGSESHHTNLPSTSNDRPCENKTDRLQLATLRSPTAREVTIATVSDGLTISGDETEQIEVSDDTTSAYKDNSARSVRKRDTYASSSCRVSLEELLQNQVKKTMAGEDTSSEADDHTAVALDQTQFHLFYKLFFNSGMSDALRIRNLATDKSGIVTWIEITRKASHIDPTFGPVDVIRILISSNGLCKLQLTYPFMRTVRTRLMPNTQDDLDSLLNELGPQSVLCPGIHDYECRFSLFSRLPPHVRIVDTLLGTKRYEHDRCLVWHVPAQSFTVPGQGLHNVCRSCRQIDGSLVRLSSQAHTMDLRHKEVVCKAPGADEGSAADNKETFYHDGEYMVVS